MTKSLYRIGFFIFLTVNIYLIYRIALQNQVTASVTTSVNEEPQSFITLKKNIIASFKNSGIVLNNPKVYYGNDASKSVDFFSLVNKKVLVFRFSGNYCEECIGAVVNVLKTNFPDYASSDRIILLGSEINERVKDGYYGKKIMSFQDKNLGFEMEKYGIPFLFIIDQSRISEAVFIPQLSQINLTHEYVSVIKSQLTK